MQGFEMLLYGTPAGDNSLYDAAQKKWVVGSQGFKDALQFVQTVYSTHLGPTPQQALGANFGTQVGTELIPRGQARHRPGRLVGAQQLAAHRPQAVAAVAVHDGHGRDADPERPGARQGQHVRRLGLVDPGEGEERRAWPSSSPPTLETESRLGEVERRQRQHPAPQGRRHRPGVPELAAHQQVLHRAGRRHPLPPRAARVHAGVDRDPEGDGVGDHRPGVGRQGRGHVRQRRQDRGRRRTTPSRAPSDQRHRGPRPRGRGRPAAARPPGASGPAAWVRSLLRGMPLLPATVLLLVFLAGPIGYCVYYAFTDMQLTGASGTSFIGLRQLHPGLQGPATSSTRSS